MDPKVSFPLARAAAAKAIALDETLSDAHVAIALVKYQGDWDWKGGEAEFKRAIELNPGDTLAIICIPICSWRSAGMRNP